MIDSVYCEIVLVGFVMNSEFERSVDVIFFFVILDVDVVRIRVFVSELVDELGVGVEVEDDGSVFGEVRNLLMISKIVIN